MRKNQKTFVALIALSAGLVEASLEAQSPPTNRFPSRPPGLFLTGTNQSLRWTNQTPRWTNQAPKWTNPAPQLTNRASRWTNRVLLLNDRVRTNNNPIPPGGSRELDKDHRLNPNDRPNPNQPVIPGPSNERGFPEDPPPNIPLKPPKPPAEPPAPN